MWYMTKNEALAVLHRSRPWCRKLGTCIFLWIITLMRKTCKYQLPAYFRKKKVPTKQAETGRKGYFYKEGFQELGPDKEKKGYFPLLTEIAPQKHCL